MKKLKERTGESIAETLVALLIAVLAITMISGAIVTAARVSTRITNEDVAFQGEGTVIPEEVHANLVLPTESGPPVKVLVKVKLWQTENGYYYYAYQGED